jgi:hypothetical protein
MRLIALLCVYMCIPRNNFLTPESIFMKLGMYIMPPKLSRQRTS